MDLVVVANQKASCRLCGWEQAKATEQQVLDHLRFGHFRLPALLHKSEEPKRTVYQGPRWATLDKPWGWKKVFDAFH